MKSIRAYHASTLPPCPALLHALELFRSLGILPADGVQYIAGTDMPYTRPMRRFYLTPPSVPVFAISVVLAILAVLAVYGHMSIFNASYAFLVLLVAYIVLLAGVLLRGV
jgi:hypothetical protein